MELPGLLTGLGLLYVQHLIYLMISAGFGMLVFFTNLSLKEFQVRYLPLFLLFSVIRGFEWFWMGSLYNIQLMINFLKPLFLVLHFSYQILMTFLMMLSVILLSMLMILLSILSQGLTIYVRRVGTQAYYYWRKHDFGHVYVDTYAHFFPTIF